MNFNLNNRNKKLQIGFVYDVPSKLVNSKIMKFPSDANAEWETEKTISRIIKTWQSLGFSVMSFPLDHLFLKRWNENVSQCSLIHSVVEGWGSLAREGWIPSLCELSGIPFIGSNPFVQSICMSKLQIKLTCEYLKIPTASFYIIKKQEDLENVPSSFFKETHFIKPDGEGSGMGIDSSYSISNSRVKSKKVVSDLLEKYPDGILLERYLGGNEYTSAIIGSPPQFLPIAQIEVDTGVYGLANKSKEIMGEKVTFPKLTKSKQNLIQKSSEKLFSFLDMKDFVRMDWKCDDKGNVYFLEANTLAGLSYYYSVIPLMAKKAGLNYQELFAKLAESALTRTHSRNLWYGKTRILKP